MGDRRSRRRKLPRSSASSRRSSFSAPDASSPRSARVSPSPRPMPTNTLNCWRSDKRRRKSGSCPAGVRPPLCASRRRKSPARRASPSRLAQQQQQQRQQQQQKQQQQQQRDVLPRSSDIAISYRNIN